jgi:uncharacterized repeat protein (TIGR01451 family)
MSRKKKLAQGRGIGIAAIIVVIWLVMLLQAMSAAAAPPGGPLAGITVTHTPTITPTITVTPTDDDGPERDPKPVITKRAEPTEARPGDEVIWIIDVTNTGNEAMIEVVVTDEVPDVLEILGATTSQGWVTVQGQRVIAEIGTVGPDFWVHIHIRTRVRPDTPPQTVENVAILNCWNCKEHWARAYLKIIGEGLPPTGGLGSWWMVAALLGTGLVGASLVLSRRDAK